VPAAGSRTTLDHTIDIETPEMVVVSYALAGVASRVLAGLIDLLICLVALVIFTVAMATMAPAVAGAVVSRTSAAWALSILILAQFAIVWCYYVLLEGLRDGQTLGKRWLGLRVVRDGGYSVSLGASAVRNLLRLVDYQPGLFSAVGIVTMASSKSGKRLGDIVAGTIVVHERALPARPAATGEARQSLTATHITASSLLTDAEFEVLARFMARRASIQATERARIAAQLATMFRPRFQEADTADAAFLVRLHEAEAAGRARGAAGRGATGASRERHMIVSEGSARWAAFAARLAYAQRRGVRRMSGPEISDFVAGYRELSNDLARLRTATRGGDPSEIFRLSRLVAGGHNLIYRDARASSRDAFRFVSRDVPREVRRSAIPIAIAATLFFAPMAIAYRAIIDTPAAAGSILPAHMLERAEGGAERARAGTGYINDPEAGRPIFGSRIIVNNLQVAFIAFAFGITGIGTVYALVMNGVMIGSVFGLYASKGIARLLLAFVAPHGVLELSAIAIAGGAGLLLAAALIMPGSVTRGEALVANGKRAVKLVACAIMFLLVAGALEGLVSPIPWWPLAWKAGVAITTLVAMVTYLSLGSGTEPTELPAP